MKTKEKLYRVCGSRFVGTFGDDPHTLDDIVTTIYYFYLERGVNVSEWDFSETNDGALKFDGETLAWNINEEENSDQYEKN